MTAGRLCVFAMQIEKNFLPLQTYLHILRRLTRFLLDPCPRPGPCRWILISALFASLVMCSLVMCAIPRTKEPKEIHATQERNLVKYQKKHLVMLYSGPTSIISDKPSEKELIYDSNFKFFLRHGLPCSYHTTLNMSVQVVISLTAATAAHYSGILTMYNRSCGDLVVIEREDRCYDMETVRVFLNSKQSIVKVSNFSFIYVNCGMLGPLLSATRPANFKFWPMLYLNMLDARVKLVGETIVCGGKRGFEHAHVGSELWATDHEGLLAIENSDAVYDCGVSVLTTEARDRLIVRYEMGLSRTIILSGYAIRSQLSRYEWSFRDFTTKSVKSECVDIWWSEESLLWEYVPADLQYPTFIKNSNRRRPKMDEIAQEMDARKVLLREIAHLGSDYDYY
jgi:hypothetical protein